jgi:hypothetical protein
VTDARERVFMRADTYDRKTGAVLCRKKPYTTRAKARTQAARQAKFYGYPMYAYKCDGCGWFHLSKRGSP